MPSPFTSQRDDFEDPLGTTKEWIADGSAELHLDGKIVIVVQELLDTGW